MIHYIIFDWLKSYINVTQYLIGWQRESWQYILWYIPDNQKIVLMSNMKYRKPCVKQPLSKRQQFGFQDWLKLDASRLDLGWPSFRPSFRHNFVSAQYLENKLIEFHQILYMHSYWQDLRWDCYTSFSHVCTRVHQILYIHSYSQDLSWDCYTSFLSAIWPFIYANGEHFAIFSTFIKLPFVIETFVLSIFEWPFYTGFTEHHIYKLYRPRLSTNFIYNNT